MEQLDGPEIIDVDWPDAKYPEEVSLRWGENYDFIQENFPNHVYPDLKNPHYKTPLTQQEISEMK